jgi:uncharacterized membrane protein
MQTLHPLLVHFPVAMLSLYAVVVIVSRIPLLKRFDLTLTKTVLVTVGFIGGFIASSSGEAIEHSFQGIRNLVEMHSTFATATNILAGIIFVIYAKIVFGPLFIEKLKPGKLQTVSMKSLAFWNTIQKNWLFMILLAVAVATTITITGVLGAVIVHGADVDPVVKMIYTTLVK